MEFQANQVNEGDKQLKGLQNKGIINFECADCGKSLLVLQVTGIEGDKRDVVLTSVAVKCMKCGGFSYVKSISGCFHPGAPSDDMSFDILDDDVCAPKADIIFKAWNK